uniref:Cytoplasmic dynein 2 intermediate chain 1 n=1 Tax=Halisarca dujardinii TaxID=2583056 RepID=A0A9F1UCS6_HALDU|nr:cytoplasmic dynein 2 intermediate chain 1 [Halisarca dujardinii]
MPTAKAKSKNDTWSEQELAKTLKQSDTARDGMKRTTDKTSKSISHGNPSKPKESSLKDKERRDKKEKQASGSSSKDSPFTSGAIGGSNSKGTSKQKTASPFTSAVFSGSKDKVSSKEKSSSSRSTQEKPPSKDKTGKPSRKDETSSKDRLEKPERSSNRGSSLKDAPSGKEASRSKEKSSNADQHRSKEKISSSKLPSGDTSEDRDRKHRKSDKEKHVSSKESIKDDRDHKPSKRKESSSKHSLESEQSKSSRSDHKREKKRDADSKGRREGEESHRRKEKDRSSTDAKLSSSSQRILKVDSSVGLLAAVSSATSLEKDSEDHSSTARLRVLDHPPSLPGDKYDEDDDDNSGEELFMTDREQHKNSLSRQPVQHMMEVGLDDGDEDDNEMPEEYEDDDFEDYDDDFEEEFEPAAEERSGEDTQGSEGEAEQLGELLVAMDAENRRLPCPGGRGDRLPRGGGGGGESDEEAASVGPKHVKSPRHRAFLDFSTVKSIKTDLVTVRRMKTRGRDLQGMIDFDIVQFEMFDLAPVSEYEVYMRSYGQRDCSQIAVQAGEESVWAESQTEEVELREVWTQHPQEGSCAVRWNDDDVSSRGSGDLEFAQPKDPQRMADFLNSASQVICILMEEEDPQDGQQGSTHQQHQGKTSLNFSVSYTKLASTYSYLGGRHWREIVFSSSSNNLLLMMLSTPSSWTSSCSGTNSKGILCLWNTREPAKPERVLVTEGKPTCCELSATKTPFVFAGMEDGSVEVWDLRSPPVRGLLGQEVEWAGLLPAYSTAHVLGQEGHTAPVQCMCVVNVQQSSGASSHLDSIDADASSNLSFQLATLDVTGRLVVWVLAELTNPDPHGSESDFGVAPGGVVKLVKSASAEVYEGPSPSSLSGGVVRTQAHSTISSVHSLAFHPQDINQYYVGSDMGSVLHCQRYGKRPIPKKFRKDIGHYTDVTAIVFSPWQPDHFLVGCGDGTISLYHHGNENPLYNWTRSTRGRRVEQIIWSNHRPGVFVVLDEASTVHLWDLLECDAAPVNKAEAQNMRIARIALSPAMRDVHKPRSLLVLSFGDGSVEIHQLSEQYSLLRESEEQLFRDYLFTLSM